MESKSSSRLADRSTFKPLLLLACLALSAGFILGCSKKKEPPPKEIVRPVKAMVVESDMEDLQRSYPGRVRAHKRAELSFKVPGRLIEIAVEEGSEVKKGQLLARLDPADYRAQLKRIQGQLSKARAALTLAKNEYDRVLRIQQEDPGAVSRSLVDKRRDQVRRAEAEIQSLQAAVDSARLNLSYTYLKAPFDGIISKRYVNNYQDIQAKEIIFHLDDLSIIEILVDIPENAMARMRADSKPKIVAEFPTAPGQKFPLEVYEFSTRADPRTQTYQVTLRMPQPEGINVLPGMTANVTATGIEKLQHKASFLVPAAALTADDQGKPCLWVIDPSDNTCHRRLVETGDLSGTDKIEIKAGLKSGEMIAISGVTMLREGMKVRPVDTIDY